MTNIFSYMESVCIAFFKKKRNPAKRGKKNYLISIPYDEQSRNREEKTRENLFSHSQFPSHSEKAVLF